MLLGVISGNAAMAIIDPPPTTAQVQAGKLRALAVTGAKRTRELPDVPTHRRGRRARTSWSDCGAASSCRPARRSRSSTSSPQELREVILNTPVRDQLDRHGGQSGRQFTPEEFRHLIAEEIKMWQTVVKEGNLKFSE